MRFAELGAKRFVAAGAVAAEVPAVVLASVAIAAIASVARPSHFEPGPEPGLELGSAARLAVEAILAAATLAAVGPRPIVGPLAAVAQDKG